MRLTREIETRADETITVESPEEAAELIGNLGGQIAAGQLRYQGWYAYRRVPSNIIRLIKLSEEER